MNIEDKPGEVTDKEGNNNGDEDDAETLLLLQMSPSQFLDGQVDLDIEKRHNGEWKDSKNKKS